jgi:TonB family protein
MALRALLFSKNPETADSLTAVLREAGIRAEVCADIFAAMEKGTKQPFACIIADWVDQPEAGFLLRRARESGPNRSTVTIAIVDGEPTPEEERENRLDFLIFRPIVADEARAVLAKARQQMQLQSTAYDTDAKGSLDHPDLEETPEPADEHPDLVATAADMPEPPPMGAPAELENEEGASHDEPEVFQPRKHIDFRKVLAVALGLAAVFCLWRSSAALRYLATTKEGTYRVLKQSVAALFYMNGANDSVGTAMTDAQQDAYFTRTPANNTRPQSLNVVSTESTLPENARLPKAFDFPLPTPEMHVDPAPARVERAQVPDSLRNAAPLARPVVVTVGPAQMMPVSTPPPQIPQNSDSIRLPEDSARALAVHTVDAIYPPEALAQKLQGAVVLQAVIGRDGSVQDLKLLRGYFVLGRAAIASVKQWRFRPSSVNGRPVEVQTVITVSFTYPPG